jgi:chromosomal replication initiator protein
MEKPHTESDAPTLRLADGNVIHCGPENTLLRHTVDRWFSLFGSSDECDSTWLPLVLYGESLCGKSLVAHGLANAWRQQFPQHATIVLTAIDLARSLQRTELAEDIDKFSRQIRNANLLVIDDVQQLAGKSNAETWFTGLLDHRIRHKKPFIVTCNSNVASSKLASRVRSRLSSGLSICISLPYAATRKDVILKSAQSFNLDLVEKDIEHLVEVTSGKTISSIQSFVASVATNDSLTNNFDATPLAPAIDQDELIQKLIRTTARRFGVKVNDIKGPSRRKNCVLARAIAMFLIRRITPLSLVEVGHHFRNRDHSTVRHACEKIKGIVVEDESIREAISSICNSLDIRLPPSWFELLNSKCA